MSSYLQEKAEGFVAQWVMQNPDGMDELDAYWFDSIVGKAIAWSVIKTRKNGPVTLETIKQHCDWNKTKAKPEHFDLVWNQSPIDDASLQYCIQHFKIEHMIMDLKEAWLGNHIKITKNQDAAIDTIIQHVKKFTDTPEMHQKIAKFWTVKLNKKPLLSKKDKMALQQDNEANLLNKLNNK